MSEQNDNPTDAEQAVTTTPTDSTDGGSFLSTDEPNEAVTEGSGEGEAVEYTDFTMPEGVEVDQEALDKALPIFKELGLNQDQAQKLVDWYVSQNSQAAEKLNEEQAQAAQDQEELARKTDNENLAAIKEEFGDQYATKKAAAHRAIRRFDADGELLAFAESAGLGSFPPFVKFLAKVGEVASEGSFLANESDGQSKPKADHLVMYGPKS